MERLGSEDDEITEDISHRAHREQRVEWIVVALVLDSGALDGRRPKWSASHSTRTSRSTRHVSALGALCVK